MTLGSGPFRSREEAKQPSDWQKYANRVALKYSCWRTLPDAHIRGWDSALDRGRVLHMCRVDYCWERGRDPPSPAKAGLKGVHRQDCRRHAAHHSPLYQDKAVTPTSLKDIFTPIWSGPLEGV